MKGRINSIRNVLAGEDDHDAIEVIVVLDPSDHLDPCVADVKDVFEYLVSGEEFHLGICEIAQPKENC